MKISEEEWSALCLSISAVVEQKESRIKELEAEIDKFKEIFTRLCDGEVSDED
jgi:predicted component of type VI protein secretion system